MHISKILTLLSIKVEEKFHSMAKAFRFFDGSQDHFIQKNEFVRGLEFLRIKLKQSDIDAVFAYLDSDKDGRLSYNEFCKIDEKKAPEPYNPYVHQVDNLPSATRSTDTLSRLKFEELEKRASELHLIH